EGYTALTRLYPFRPYLLARLTNCLYRIDQILKEIVNRNGLYFEIELQIQHGKGAGETNRRLRLELDESRSGLDRGENESHYHKRRFCKPAQHLLNELPSSRIRAPWAFLRFLRNVFQALPFQEA